MQSAGQFEWQEQAFFKFFYMATTVTCVEPNLWEFDPIKKMGHFLRNTHKVINVCDGRSIVDDQDRLLLSSVLFSLLFKYRFLKFIFEIQQR